MGISCGGNRKDTIDSEVVLIVVLLKPPIACVLLSVADVVVLAVEKVELMSGPGRMTAGLGVGAGTGGGGRNVRTAHMQAHTQALSFPMRYEQDCIGCKTALAASQSVHA